MLWSHLDPSQTNPTHQNPYFISVCHPMISSLGGHRPSPRVSNTIARCHSHRSKSHHLQGPFANALFTSPTTVSYVHPGDVMFIAFAAIIYQHKQQQKQSDSRAWARMRCQKMSRFIEVGTPKNICGGFFDCWQHWFFDKSNVSRLPTLLKVF